MRLPAAVLLLISCCSILSTQAQSNELIVQGQTGKLYLEHIVVAKETWYSLGRLYNISPKFAAAYNHLTFAQPLVIGQVVQVPLTGENFSQDGKKLPAETLVPVIHIVQEKEWLYRISVNHNKVPIPVLEKWNHVTGDQVRPGLHLIVGWLKVKTALSALATSAKAPVIASAAPVRAGKAETGQEGNGKTTGAGVAPTKTEGMVDSGKGTTGAPAMGAPAVVASVAAAPVVKADSAVNTAPKPAAPVVASPGSGARGGTMGEVKGGASSGTVNSGGTVNFNGGKFRSEFSDNGKSLSGQAGIFKSTSGWQDGKYYALINNVPVGTIVKISDAGTGKSVYAKVLGQLPDMKESTGLTIRLSNAAAAELGEGDARFNVALSY